MIFTSRVRKMRREDESWTRGSPATLPSKAHVSTSNCLFEAHRQVFGLAGAPSLAETSAVV
jgi:hypothetical protein